MIPRLLSACFRRHGPAETERAFADVNRHPVLAGPTHDVGVPSTSYQIGLDDFISVLGMGNCHVYNFVIAVVDTLLIVHRFSYSSPVGRIRSLDAL